jgi:PTS system nitrogen regulatory IIA component
VKISDFLDESLIEVNLEARDKRGVIEEMVDLMVRAGKIQNKEKVVEVLMEREDLGSTGIGQGVAIPHGKVEEVSRAVGAFGRSKAGVDFKALDNQGVHLFFMLIAPKSDASMHLKCLARVSRLLKDEDFRRRLREAPTTEEIMRIFTEGDKKL